MFYSIGVSAAALAFILVTWAELTVIFQDVCPLSSLYLSGPVINSRTRLRVCSELSVAQVFFCCTSSNRHWTHSPSHPLLGSVDPLDCALYKEIVGASSCTHDFALCYSSEDAFR